MCSFFFCQQQEGVDPSVPVIRYEERITNDVDSVVITYSENAVIMHGLVHTTSYATVGHDTKDQKVAKKKRLTIKQVKVSVIE